MYLIVILGCLNGADSQWFGCFEVLLLSDLDLGNRKAAIRRSEILNGQYLLLITSAGELMIVIVVKSLRYKGRAYREAILHHLFGRPFGVQFGLCHQMLIVFDYDNRFLLENLQQRLTTIILLLQVLL